MELKYETEFKQEMVSSSEQQFFRHFDQKDNATKILTVQSQSEISLSSLHPVLIQRLQLQLWRELLVNWVF